MSPLRKQLEDDIAIRGMSERTRETYGGAVAALAKHYGRSPDRIGQEETQRNLLHLLKERQEVAPQAHHNRLRLGIDQPAVELEHLRVAGAVDHHASADPHAVCDARTELDRARCR